MENNRERTYILKEQLVNDEDFMKNLMRHFWTTQMVPLDETKSYVYKDTKTYFDKFEYESLYEVGGFFSVNAREDLINGEGKARQYFLDYKKHKNANAKRYALPENAFSLPIAVLSERVDERGLSEILKVEDTHTHYYFQHVGMGLSNASQGGAFFELVVNNVKLVDVGVLYTMMAIVAQNLRM